MKKINALYVLCVFSLLLSCTNNTKGKQTVSENTVKEQTTTALSVSELMKKGELMADSSVVVKGIIDHICKHSDKRFKITDGENDIKVELNNNMPSTTTSLVGKTVIVSGILKSAQMDEAMLRKWKMKEKKEHAPEKNSEQFIHEAEEINSILERLEAGDISVYTTYHIDALKYEIE